MANDNGKNGGGGSDSGGRDLKQPRGSNQGHIRDGNSNIPTGKVTGDMTG